jgi:heme oxygenase
METTLHQFLKEGTRKRHESAEVHPFQGALAQGTLPLESYKQYLCQLRHLHSQFEQKLQAAAESDPHVRSVFNAEYLQLPFLDRDVSALGVQDLPPPVECIAEFAANPIFDSAPVSLLGTLYVLLGSKHGGRFIAHKTKEVYQLDEAGYTYFSPYGEHFRDLWQGFTAGLNALPQTALVRNSTLEAADATFTIFVEIGDAIWRAEQSALPTAT